MPDVTAAEDEARAVATLTVAFSADPVTRWWLPDAQQYLTYWPRFIEAFAAPALASGTADAIDDGAGVSLWHPPGVAADETAMGAIALEAVPAEDREKVFGVLAQTSAFHPEEPHWYLPMIGVDTSRRGRSYGSALLRHGLDRCDRDGAPAYLEASSERSRALYERHGFEVLGVIQGFDSPPTWPMVRKPGGG